MCFLFSKRRIAFLTRIISFASGVAITVWTLALRKKEKEKKEEEEGEKEEAV